MTLNISQVSYYMIQRKKGITQHISVMNAGILVRSGRRFEKGLWAKTVFVTGAHAKTLWNLCGAAYSLMRRWRWRQQTS